MGAYIDPEGEYYRVGDVRTRIEELETEVIYLENIIIRGAELSKPLDKLYVESHPNEVPGSVEEYLPDTGSMMTWAAEMLTYLQATRPKLYLRILGRVVEARETL